MTNLPRVGFQFPLRAPAPGRFDTGDVSSSHPEGHSQLHTARGFDTINLVIYVQGD